MQLKYLITLVSALGLTQAQLPNLPDCSLNCFLGALQNDGCSSLTNFTCHCAVPSLVGAITPCVQGACDIADQASVSNAVTSVCSSAGVPVSIPPVTGTTTAAGSATTTASGSTTPSRTSSSSSAVGGASSGSSATSPSNSQTTSASTSTGTGATSGGSTTGTTTSTTTSTGAAHSTGAAVSVSAPFVGTGVLAMGVAAVFALC